ncbi:MAG: hypothetical protein R2834_15020 [Rhodothermales bacterium]
MNDPALPEGSGEASPEDELSQRADVMRKRYQYRRLIMKHKMGLSPASAAKLIGPDCAYHLYRHLTGTGKRDDTEG